MTALTHWIHTPAAQALGWTLFHFLWQGVAIAAALALALQTLRGPRTRYAAACLALAAMLGACAATFVRVLPEQPGERPAPVRVLRGAPSGDMAPAAPGGFRAEDLLPWAAPIWLAGVLLLHARMLAGWMTVRRLRASGVPAPAPWRDRLAALAAGVRLSAPVALLESCVVDGPVVVGYLRPAILLPLGLLTGMPTGQLEAVLLHELAHIRRRDYLVNLMQTVAENLLFYHPAVWWVSRVIRAEREHCCDDLVVAVRGDAHGYAAALTALEARRVTGEPALAATGGELMKRVHRLLGRSEPPHAALTPAISAALVLVTAAVALAAWQPNPAPPAPQQAPIAQKEQARRQAAQANLEQPYDKWLNEDVVYIIDDRERAAFLSLGSNEEREHFIEQFWARRDPTPGTVENEFKQEHYRRIAYANQRFTAGDVTGWKSDRGRVYIVYGPPDEIESHPKGNAGKAYPFEQWLYRQIPGVGQNVVVDFEDRARSGQYRMTSDPAARRKADRGLIRMHAPGGEVRPGEGAIVVVDPSRGGAHVMVLEAGVLWAGARLPR